MKGPELATQNPDVRLVEPDIERDSILGAQWLEGSLGRSTLRLMGVPEKHIKPTTIAQERQRIQDFITKQGQLNWMIEFQRKVVGSVWADLEPTEHLPSPAVHIMVWNPDVRRCGIGFSAASTVIQHLEQSHLYIYSRHLIMNSGARRLLDKLNFNPFGPTYEDQDGLEWQNALRLTNQLNA